MHTPPELLLVTGLAVGVVYGMFGAGGSAFATPVLAVLGVPPIVAVASPLPATIPAALAGAWTYVRSGQLDRRLAARAAAAGAPAAVLGALASRYVDGRALLVLSGAVMLVLGARVAFGSGGSGDPGPGASLVAPERLTLAAAAAGVVGFLTGLLANSGGFLLVPLFVVVLGLSMRVAAGTSLVVAAALTVPTVVTHVALGNVAWPVAIAFGAGLVPGSAVGARLSAHVPPWMTQRAFGTVLVAFAAWFLVRLA